MISKIQYTNLPEDFLYYLWKVKQFDHRELTTSDGRALQILEYGTRNDHAGPDFLQAKIQIDDTIWVGHVEMHIKASDWKQHGHQSDPSYQNVILHVVMVNDQEIELPNGEPLPCLELQTKVDSTVIRKYHQLMGSLSWVPCEKSISQTSPLIMKTWLERVLVERLETKTVRIKQVLEETENDWEEAFYRLLARNFGFSVNGDVFESLARSLPRKLLLKHKDQITQIEALLFGQAGFLDHSFEHAYPQRLKEEYQFLKTKYDLSPIDAHLWKFMRMRPRNFPTIRLAQFAVLFFRSNHLFSKMLAAVSIQEVYEMFRTEVTPYWKDHFVFEEPSRKQSKKLGKGSIQLLLINTVAPFLFTYGKLHSNDTLQQKAIDFLSQLPAESNKIVRGFSSIGVTAENAVESQALLQLKNEYCDRKVCLECSIGHGLLTKTDTQVL